MPFAVLLCSGFIHPDFALADELFKPILAADQFCSNGFAECNASLFEYEAYQIKRVAIFHYTFLFFAFESLSFGFEGFEEVDFDR